MALQIRLLGRPNAELAGRRIPGPRGRKSWALLAVLVLADQAPSRNSLAALLFPDANDPLGALRWAMSQLRRAFDGHVTVGGDPVGVWLGTDCRIDALDVLNAVDNGKLGSLDLAEPLLEGADGIAGPDFDLWLTVARNRVDAVRGAQLRSAARQHLAEAKPAAAVLTAARGLVVEPHEPAARGLLISSLVANGDHAAALNQLRDWGAWIRKEQRIGCQANQPRPGRDRPLQSNLDVLCRIEAGEAAMVAGAVSVGINHLRDAVRLARRADERLAATALFAFGGSLVHALAAHSGEGCEALRAAARLAHQAGDHRLAADALCDLAFVENTSGRVQSTRRMLSAAANAAGDDSRAMSSVCAIEGMHLADRGRHKRALAALRRSTELAESAGRIRQAAWSISIASRSLLEMDEFDRAADYAHLAVQIATEERWTAMLPWMDTIIAELELSSGRVDEAERRLRHAWSLSLLLDDWCWQGMTARGLGLVAFDRGDLSSALRWLDEAERRARQDKDRYVWIHAWVQDARCRVSVAAQLETASEDVVQLARIAAHSHLPDFAVRAELHRVALGEPSARERARALAESTDNPALVRTAARAASKRCSA